VGLTMERLTIRQIAENLIESAIKITDTIIHGGIYILYKDGQAVYVGQTSNLSNRLYSHKTKIEFDVVMFCQEEDKEKRKVYEKILILHLKTTLNINGRYLNWYDYRKLGKMMRQHIGTNLKGDGDRAGTGRRVH